MWIHSRHKSILLSILFISIIVSSGCLDNKFFDSKITYEESPVQVSYDLSYGYHINITGNGKATVFYQEYIPQSKQGTIYSIEINPFQQIQDQQDTNQLIIWNETIQNTSNHTYFISASIIQNPTLITDLTGKNALTIAQIHEQYPEIVKSYCHSMGNETKTIINPNHPLLSTLAQTVKDQADTTNAFLLGKQLFSWLKNNTNYEKHANFQPQPADETYEKGVGDCDDLTYLYLSLCKAVGIPSRYIKGYLISNNTAIPHVWAELFVGKEISENGWIPVECAGTGSSTSEIHNNYGIEDAQHIRLCVDDGTNETFQKLTNPLKIQYDQRLDVNINRVEQVKNYTILSSKQLTIKEDQRTFE